MGAPPHAPGDFLAKRKSPKIRQEPPGLEFGELLTSGTRGRTPLDSPALCPSGIVRGNLNHQASSGGTPPAMPRIDSRECFPDGAEGKNKTDLLTNSKWQIGLFLWLKVARREPERSAASAKRAATTHRGIPKGAALGAPLVTFPATGKSPGCRAERLHQGWSAEEGATLLARGVRRGAAPLAKESPVRC